jgi:pyruvate-formate lyase-activating enzyme
MGKKQWGHGYNRGAEEQRFSDFCHSDSHDRVNKMSIHDYLSRIEEQIKLLQDSWMCKNQDHPLFHWCETTLETVNAAHRAHGLKYEQIANKAMNATEAAQQD